MTLKESSSCLNIVQFSFPYVRPKAHTFIAIVVIEIRAELYVSLISCGQE